MSVLVRGMKMPNYCADCCLIEEDEEHTPYCPIINKSIDSWNLWISRLSDCPLIEVFTPHGRLIDEKCINEVTAWRGGYDNKIYGSIFETDAPTVIEAEGEE